MQSCLQTAMSTNQGKQQRIMKPIIPIIVLTLISAATTASGQVLAQGITPEGLTTSTDTATRTTPLMENTQGLTTSTDTATRMTPLTENTQGRTVRADSPAQQAQAKALTLRECMEYAVSNSTQVRIQQSNIASRLSSLVHNII